MTKNSRAAPRSEIADGRHMQSLLGLVMVDWDRSDAHVTYMTAYVKKRREQVRRT